MTQRGYKKIRFPNLQGQIFDCLLCQNVVKAPKECSGCGNLFCTECIEGYSSLGKGKCPNRCNDTITNMSARALINIYNDLDIKCSKCPKTLKLAQLQKHEDQCGRPKCMYAQFCQGFESKKQEDYFPFCSPKCDLLNKIIEAKGDNKKVYELLVKVNPTIVNSLSMSTSSTNLSILGGSSTSPLVSTSGTGGLLNMKWSKSECGMNINITPDQSTVFLKEEAYVFRTVLATEPFMSGRHYWEIHADERTENQLKIGVSASNKFQFNTAFCDHKFGFAYYGLGQLRHGSNATGSQYGKRFKKTGILGVYLNMDKGTLSFSLNGEDFGEAYTDVELKKGPLYAAVALLHCSGCKIKGELPIPSIYASK